VKSEEFDKLGNSFERSMRVSKNRELKVEGDKKSSVAVRRDGKRYLLEWVSGDNFSGLDNVKQVYGYLFDNDGKLLIVNPKSSWRLPGGGVEESDSSYEETLIREATEEADADISNLIGLGYIKVSPFNEDDEDAHYLVRYIGKIARLNEQTIDEAVGEVNDRKLIDVGEFSDYIDWGEMGLEILRLAVEVRDER
jgi:8-oxo-dGTP pyrophosphatase MutT (NUDIX family)